MSDVQPLNPEQEINMTTHNGNPANHLFAYTVD